MPACAHTAGRKKVTCTPPPLRKAQCNSECDMNKWLSVLSTCVCRHTPDWTFFFFFFCFSLAPILFFLSSSSGSSGSTESESSEGASSDFLFLCRRGSSPPFSSALLFFFTSRRSFGSVLLCFSFSFAFCCSLASSTWDRASFGTLSLSSSPRYLRAAWQNVTMLQILATTWKEVGLHDSIQYSQNSLLENQPEECGKRSEEENKTFIP